jgi:hypothetical protein
VNNSIILKNYGNNFEMKVAASTIYPGMLIEPASATTVQAHSTEGGNAGADFAIEDALQGNDIDDAYSADDQVRVWHAQPGDQVLACLADGENVSAGDYLQSKGDGTLEAFDASLGIVSGGEYRPASVKFRALEARNIATSSGGETGWSGGYNRIKIEIV